MNQKKLEEIKEKIEHLKVTRYQEKKMTTNSNFMSIIKGNYTLNNHKVIEREKIIKNIGTGNAVCIFSITKENKIVLVLQVRTALPTDSKVNIEIPAGYIDKEEDKEIAAKRELEEETGYVSPQLIYLDSYFPSQGGSSEKIDLFLAIDCEKKKPQKLDPDEFIEYIEVDFDEYEYLLENHYMLDANCRIAYYKALEYLEKKKFTDIIKILIKKKETISTMESCTGGYLANCITNIEDSSKVFKYGAVTYNNEYKIKMGVNKKTIETYSVYSKECAQEMAYQISQFSDSDYGIGITGTLKKYDENNLTKEDNKVYISIYDKKKEKYITREYQVSSNIRIYNKRTVILNIANILETIL